MKKFLKPIALFISVLSLLIIIISCSPKRVNSDAAFNVFKTIEESLSNNQLFNANHNFYYDSAKDDYFEDIKRVLPSTLLVRSFSFNTENMATEVFESQTQFFNADDYILDSNRQVLTTKDDNNLSFAGIFYEVSQKSRQDAKRAETTNLYKKPVESLKLESDKILQENYFYNYFLQMIRFYESGQSTMIFKDAAFTLKQGIYTAKIKSTVYDNALTYKKSFTVKFDSQSLISAQAKVQTYIGKDFVTATRDKLTISYKSGAPLLSNDINVYKLIN